MTPQPTRGQCRDPVRLESLQVVSSEPSQQVVPGLRCRTETRLVEGCARSGGNGALHIAARSAKHIGDLAPNRWLPRVAALLAARARRNSDDPTGVPKILTPLRLHTSSPRSVRSSGHKTLSVPESASKPRSVRVDPRELLPQPSQKAWDDAQRRDQIEHEVRLSQC